MGNIFAKPLELRGGGALPLLISWRRRRAVWDRAGEESYVLPDTWKLKWKNKISREREKRRKCVLASFPFRGNFVFKILYIVSGKPKRGYSTEYYSPWAARFADRPLHAQSTAALPAVHRAAPSAAQTKHNSTIKLSLSAGRLALIGIHSCPLHVLSLPAGRGGPARLNDVTVCSELLSARRGALSTRRKKNHDCRL